MEALRRYVPDWSKNSTLIPVRKEDGDLKYIDFSHANAYDTLVRPFQAVLNSVAAGNEDEDGKITIKSSNPIWRNELSLQKQDLFTKIKKAQPELNIKEIIFNGSFGDFCSHFPVGILPQHLFWRSVVLGILVRQIDHTTS